LTTTTPKKICLLFTGGTIAMVPEAGVKDSGRYTPDTPVDFREMIPEINQLHTHLPEAPHLAHVEVVLNRDSTNIGPLEWQAVARRVWELAGDFDAFVITHGTDTMVYTATALSFMLRTLNKPVVVTGSQVPLTGQLVVDAKNNLFNAFRVAAKGASVGLCEVVILFGSKILRPSRAVKVSTFDFDAFESFNAPELGRLGAGMQFNSDLFLPRSAGDPVLEDHLNPDVMLLKLAPGLQPKVIDALVGTGISGLVIEAYGAGNIPNGDAGVYSLRPAIDRATTKDVIVSVCSQCLVGTTEPGLYAVGSQGEGGIIHAYDMTPSTTVVKLMWLLGKHGQAQSKIRLDMHRSFVGELDESLSRI